VLTSKNKSESSNKQPKGAPQALRKLKNKPIPNPEEGRNNKHQTEINEIETKKNDTKNH
jgi:hypothetical protein